MPPIQPNKAKAPIPHSIHAIGFALLLGVSKLPFGTTSANEFVAPWVWILLGFRCFGTMPIRAILHRLPLRSWPSFAIRLLVFALYFPRSVRRLDLRATCGPTKQGQSSHPTLYPRHRFCFAFRGFEAAVRHASNPTKQGQSSHPTLYPRHRFSFAFRGFEAAVRHHVCERIRGPLGLNPAGVPLFRNHASNPTKQGQSSHPTLYPRHWFCFAFRGFEAAVRHHVCERIRGPLGLNPAGVPLFRNHASNPTKQGQSSHPTLYPRHRFCFAFRGFEATVRHHVCERIRGPLGLNPAGVPLFRNHASNPTKQGQSSHPTLYPRHWFCFAFRGFEAAVRHHVCERIRGPLGLNPAGVPLFRNHASNPTKQGQSSHPTLYPRHWFCFAFRGFEAAVRHHVCERIRGPLGLNPAGVPLFRNHAHPSHFT